jgi:hypothetical protein
MRGSPIGAGADVDPQGHIERDRRLGGALHDGANDPGRGLDLAFGRFEDELVMDLRPRPSASSAGAILAMARLMMSAAVP